MSPSDNAIIDSIIASGMKPLQYVRFITAISRCLDLIPDGSLGSFAHNDTFGLNAFQIINNNSIPNYRVALRYTSRLNIDSLQIVIEFTGSDNRPYTSTYTYDYEDFEDEQVLVNLICKQVIKTYKINIDY